jgi:hypothetical protein
MTLPIIQRYIYIYQTRIQGVPPLFAKIFEIDRETKLEKYLKLPLDFM